jgi:hypothetical protein
MHFLKDFSTIIIRPLRIRGLLTALGSDRHVPQSVFFRGPQ